jgi:hypothetical protein
MVGRTRLIYPARRAIEHAVSLPDVRPTRFFAVLWPLWQVETTAQVYEEQAYEVLDRFLVRAVLDAGLNGIDDLAGFLGLQVSLVERCMSFLSLIGHVSVENRTIALTELGVHSARTGIRFVPKEGRQRLLIDRFTMRPLPRSHYDGSIAVLTTPEVNPDEVADRTHFLPLFSPAPFRPEVVQQLAQRADRAQFNLPSQLRNLEVVAEQDVYLPAYLIETSTGGLLAYTGVGDRRDEFMEALCRDVATIRQLISAEASGDNMMQVWRQWLEDKDLRRGHLHQLPNGVWRATLLPEAFGAPPRLPLSRLGSFELRRHHFLQLWCNDAGLRRRAALDRALGLVQLRAVKTLPDLTTRLEGLARQLGVAAPTIPELRRHAQRNQQYDRLVRLDTLEAGDGGSGATPGGDAGAARSQA